MAKIAVELERELARRALTGAPGGTTTRWLARGEGWMVGDVVCTSGPGDRPFEERHANVAIAIVTADAAQGRRARSSRGVRPDFPVLRLPPLRAYRTQAGGSARPLAARKSAPLGPRSRRPHG